MNKLVELNNEQVVTTSLVVAESFGKEHKHVLRDIRNLEKDVPNFGLMFSETETLDSYGRSRKTYYINRDGFTLLAMGFNGKEALQFKLEYIEAFNLMEQELKQPKLSTKELLLRATNEHEQRIEKLETKVQKAFDDARKKRVIEVLGGYDSNAYKQMARKVFAACSRDVKRLFTIPRYNELPKADFEAAIDFISGWSPDAVITYEINTLNNQTKMDI